MKRAQEATQNANNSTGVDQRAKKKPRSNIACLSCRKHKARCELQSGDIVCHRCQVLATDCVFGAPLHSITQSSPLERRAEEATTVTPARQSPIEHSADSATNISVTSRLKAVEDATEALLLQANLPPLSSFLNSHISNYSHHPSNPLSAALTPAKKEVASEVILMTNTDHYTTLQFWNPEMRVVEELLHSSGGVSRRDDDINTSRHYETCGFEGILSTERVNILLDMQVAPCFIRFLFKTFLVIAISMSHG